MAIPLEHVSEPPSPCCWCPFHDGKIVSVDFHSGKHCTLTLPDGSEQDIKIFAPRRMFDGSTFLAELHQQNSDAFNVDFFGMTQLCGENVDTCLAERLPQMIDVLHSIRCVHEHPTVLFSTKTFQFTTPNTEALIFDLKDTALTCRVYSPLPRICLQLTVQENYDCQVPSDVAKLSDLCTFSITTADRVDITKNIANFPVAVEFSVLPRTGPCIFTIEKINGIVALKLKGPTSDAPITLASVIELLTQGGELRGVVNIGGEATLSRPNPT